jgi:hypothetical protein
LHLKQVQIANAGNQTNFAPRDPNKSTTVDRGTIQGTPATPEQTRRSSAYIIGWG